MNIPVIKKPSPNFWESRNGHKPEAIVIHIMDGTLAGTDDWFSRPSSQVSAHYGIGRNGEVHQYVEEPRAAWHAGSVFQATWKLLKAGINPNLYTIGIEHEGKPGDVWTDAMKFTSAALIRQISQRYAIPLDRLHVIGHYEITAKKPNCPANSKAIIDELVELAKKDGRAEGTELIEKGLALIKKYT